MTAQPSKLMLFARRHWPEVWPYLLVAILAFSVYATTLSNGFVWDDPALLLTNPDVTDVHKIPEIFQQGGWVLGREDEQGRTNYYRPVQILAYAAVYRIAGFSAFAFHLLMVLIHTVNTLLVFFLSRHFFQNFSRPRDAALVAAAIFAVHPIHTEAVAWVTVPDILLTLLGLCMFALFVREDASPRRWQIAGQTALFFAALLTKETGAMLLPMLVGFEWLYLGRSVRQIWNNRALYASLLGVFGIYLVLRVQALGGLAPAQGRNLQLTAAEFVSNAIALMGRYLGALVWPTNLSCYHPFERVSTLSLPVVLSLALLAAVGAAIVLLRHRLPVASFGLFFIVIPLLPVMNLTGLGEAVFGERYLYLPSVGFAWIAGLAWLWLNTKSRAAATGAAIAVLVVFGYSAMSRALDWHDNFSLWTRAIEVGPESATPHNNLGNELIQIPGRVPDAIAEYRLALRISPAYSRAHYNLANALLREPGKLPDAISEYQAALQTRPDFAEAHNNLGKALAQVPGRLADAVAEYEAALRIRPSYAAAHNNLGNALLRMPGRLPDAISQYQAALRIEPGIAEAHYNLGNALLQAPLRLQDAIAEFETSARIRPDFAEAHNSLGGALARTPGKIPDAIAEFEIALRIRPDYADAHSNLGRALLQVSGRRSDAIAEFEIAQRLRPDPEDRQMLDRLLAERQ
jgi:tetratricopeptide (TPR) repeat protein